MITIGGFDTNEQLFAFAFDVCQFFNEINNRTFTGWEVAMYTAELVQAIEGHDKSYIESVMYRLREEIAEGNEEAKGLLDELMEV